jgi:hypothetical protein
MKPNLEKRLETLEASQKGQTKTVDDPERELLDIILVDYYTGRESQLTPEQEQMLRDTEQWYRDEGLWDLYFGADGQ